MTFHRLLFFAESPRTPWPPNPAEYTLAETARTAAIEIIRYRSVRDPKHGVNLALLTCRVFKNPQPVSCQTWRIRLSAAGAQAICESPKYGLGFDRETFAADPRIAEMGSLNRPAIDILRTSASGINPRSLTVRGLQHPRTRCCSTRGAAIEVTTNLPAREFVAQAA